MVVFAACVVAEIASAQALPAKEADGEAAPKILRGMSIEELMQIKVTTVSRTESTVGRSPAAVTVITAEDIRRSGATSIAELFRMVPGMAVVRGAENGGWLVSSRGFNFIPANKLLVLVDGRSVYSPVSSGVFWDVQDTLMEDIDRIEIIRGPDGSLWGSNAVNGIVNIVTKSAKATQGTLLMGGGGTYERAFGGVRHGWKIGEDNYARVYVKRLERDELRLSTASAADPWELTQAGFRSDWQTTSVNRFTFQGDLYAGDRLNPNRSELFGFNVLGRWTHDLANGGELKLQAYFDRTDRIIPALFTGVSDTADVDFQHRIPWGERQTLTWGLGYRSVWNQVDTTPVVIASPAHATTGLYSAFVQDEIELVRDRLRLTLGTKFERNDFTGLELQPNARVLWTVTPHQSAWASISRAVRIPTVQENSSAIKPGAITTFGNQDFVSENVVAYELGYRAQPARWLSLDAATFLNQYDDLASSEVITGTTRLRSNKLNGETYGAELGATWQPSDWFRMQAAYTYLHMSLHLDPGSTDTTSVATQRNDPQQQLYLRGSWNLSRHVQFDATARYVDRLPNLAVPAYTAVDLRLAWRPTERIEMAIVGQNLFDNRHLEFPSGAVRKEIPRGVYGKITWSF